MAKDGNRRLGSVQPRTLSSSTAANVEDLALIFLLSGFCPRKLLFLVD